MATPRDAVPSLKILSETESVINLKSEPTWEVHPDGKGGLRPISEENRGAVNIPCPSCGAPLIRDALATYVRLSAFKCSGCKSAVVGSAVRTSDSSPE